MTTSSAEHLFDRLLTVRQIKHLKAMPKALATLTSVFAVCGVAILLIAIIPGDNWTYENRPVTYGEFWRTGAGVLVVGVAIALILFAVGFYKAHGWVRYAFPLSLGTVMIYSSLRPDSTGNEWVGCLVWGILAYWYFFWKRTVVDYFKSRRTGVRRPA